jgi:hypothetical protein
MSADVSAILPRTLFVTLSRVTYKNLHPYQNTIQATQAYGFPYTAVPKAHVFLISTSCTW